MEADDAERREEKCGEVEHLSAVPAHRGAQRNADEGSDEAARLGRPEPRPEGCHLLPDRLPSREDAHFDERERSGAGIDHRVFLAVDKSHDAAGTNLVLFAVHDDLALSIDEVEHLSVPVPVGRRLDAGIHLREPHEHEITVVGPHDLLVDDPGSDPFLPRFFRQVPHDRAHGPTQERARRAGIRTWMIRRAFSRYRGISWARDKADDRAGPEDGSSRGLEFREDPKVLPQVPCDEEMAANPFAAGPSHRLPTRRIAQELDGPIRGLLDAGDKVSVPPIFDLESNPPDVPAHDRDALPQRFADDETESLPKGFRQRDIRFSLEHVDLERADPAEVRHEVDIGILAGVPGRSLEPHPPLRIVAGHRRDQEELDLRDFLLAEPVRVDPRARILPSVEPSHLADDRPVEVDVEARQDRLPLLAVNVAGLRARRIDRGWVHVDTWEAHAGGYVFPRAEDGGVVRFEVRREDSKDGRVRGRQVKMATPDPCAFPLAQVDQWRRLWVVNDDVVVLILKTRRIELVEVAVGRLHVRPENDVRSLEGIVHGLRRREERVRPR